MKTCTKCRSVKPVTEFYKDASKHDGLRSWCKTCSRESEVQWRITNPERHRANGAEWYAANAEKHRAAATQRRAAKRVRELQNGGNMLKRVAERLNAANLENAGGMKTCSQCHETKFGNEFGKDAHNRDGLRSCCKACEKVSRAKYNAANREKRKALDAANYAANSDKMKARHARWRLANIKKVKAYEAAYCAANRARRKASTTAWRAANPEACRAIVQNYRARKLKAGGILSPGLSERLFNLQRGKCACCGKPLGDDYHMDHIMPLALDGTNTDDNIQLLRRRCNNQKHAKHPIDFMQQRGFLL